MAIIMRNKEKEKRKKSNCSGIGDSVTIGVCSGIAAIRKGGEMLCRCTPRSFDGRLDSVEGD